MCTALVSRWDGQWQVFVLDAETGLVGTLEIESWDDVEPDVRAFLSRRHGRPAESFQVEVVHYGRRDFTPSHPTPDHPLQPNDAHDASGRPSPRVRS